MGSAPPIHTVRFGDCADQLEAVAEGATALRTSPFGVTTETEAGPMLWRGPSVTPGPHPAAAASAAVTGSTDRGERQ
jgi:hypothetical protein